MSPALEGRVLTTGLAGKSSRLHIYIFLHLDFLMYITVGDDQFSSVAQSCLILCDPMDCSMPGLPVHHQLWEFTQIHVD